MSGVQFKESWLTNTRIPRTELEEIIQTSLSPPIIVALLNEAERGYFKEHNDFHFNRKYVYPHWKKCQRCGQPFQAMTREQASRNKFCSQGCVNERISEARQGETPPEERDGMVQVECATCGKEFWRPRSHAKRVEKSYCSYECNGVARGEEWAKHAHKARENWSEKAEEELKERMTGESNPSWKGGVTKKKRHGNYKNEIMVRCPEKYSEMARSNGYVPEHRLKVAKALGRPLDSNEVVHHIDHDNHNNDLDNLALFPSNRAHKLYEHHGEPEPVWRGSNHKNTEG